MLIPETYVRDLPVRLGLYRRIGALTEAEIEAMAAELADRFGPLPPEVENLLQVVAIKALCRDAGVEKLDAGPKGMVLHSATTPSATPPAWSPGSAAAKEPIRLRPDHKLAVVQEMGVAERMRVGRDVLANLNRLANEGAGPLKMLF